MDNNQFNSQGGSSGKKVLGFIGLGCSSLGCLLTLIFTIVTCSRGYNASRKMYGFPYKMKMSKWVIAVIFALLISIAGVVLSILSIERGTQMSKIALIAVIVGSVAILYGVFSTATICGYNCSYNNEIEEQMKGVSSYFD